MYAQTAYDTMDDVITYVMNRRAHDDIFFAVHTLKVARQHNPATGKMKVYRTHDNMKESRAFFFDLDVGDEDGKYAGQSAALAGLERFLFLVPLPAPIVTSSGNGLHVYWTVDTAIPSTEWREWADKLHFLAQRYGLKADPMRTTDQSSVLRVVNTSNFKDRQHPRKVVVLRDGERVGTDTFTALLDELCGDQYTPVGYSAPTGADPDAPFEWDGRLTPVEELVENCAYVRDFRDQAGCVPEPYWHVMIGLIKYADEGQRYCHEWSQGHAKYSHAETQDKIDMWTTRPPSCDKIKVNCGGDKCASCPVKAAGKNPLAISNHVWGQRNAPAPMLLANAQTEIGEVTTLVNPPYPYERKLNGINRKVQDDDEVDPTKKKRFVRILDYDMFPIHQFNGVEASSGFSRWVVTLPLAGQRIFDVPTASFDQRQLHQCLLDEGVIVGGKMIGEVRDFMLAYLKQLQKVVKAHQQYDYMGWEVTANKDERPPAFILHGKKIDVATGDVSPVAMSKTMGGVKDFMCKAGSLQKQIELLKFYKHTNYIPHQFIILASMGTPFFMFTGQNGVILNLSGDSGVSKSQALYTCASIYGHPKRYPLSGIPGSTTRNGREDRSFMLANLPFLIDEITLMSPDEARSLVLGDTQPSLGGKMDKNRSAKRMRGGEKSNIMICSANSSLHQLINTSNVAGQAGTVRVFEMHVKKNLLTVHHKWEADAYMRELMHNYGWIGEEILTQLAPHLELIERRIIKEMARLDILLKAEASERFWVAVCATVMVIGRLLFSLGFHEYDMEAIEEWLVLTQFPFLRGTVAQEIDRHDGISVVMDYLDSIHGDTIRIEPDANGNVSGMLQVPHSDLKAHFDLTKREIWVRNDPFRKHCERNGHPYAAIMRELVDKGIVSHTNVKRTLGQGTQYAIGRVICFVINLRHPDVAPLSVAPASSTMDDVDPTLSNVIPMRKKKDGRGNPGRADVAAGPHAPQPDADDGADASEDGA